MSNALPSDVLSSAMPGEAHREHTRQEGQCLHATSRHSPPQHNLGEVTKTTRGSTLTAGRPQSVDDARERHQGTKPRRGRARSQHRRLPSFGPPQPVGGKSSGGPESSPAPKLSVRTRIRACGRPSLRRWGRRKGRPRSPRPRRGPQPPSSRRPPHVLPMAAAEPLRQPDPHHQTSGAMRSSEADNYCDRGVSGPGLFSEPPVVNGCRLPRMPVLVHWRAVSPCKLRNQPAATGKANTSRGWDQRRPRRSTAD